MAGEKIIPKRVIKDGESFEVVDLFGDEVRVICPFDFAEPPYKRDLELWWNLEDCDTVEWD